MQHLSTAAVAAILFIVGATACSEEPEPVNAKYLESDLYTSFEERAKAEFSAQLWDYQSLQSYLRQLVKCDKGRFFSFPLQIDRAKISKFTEGPYLKCEALAGFNDWGFGVKNIGYSRFEDVFIRWILVEKESVYRDWELLAVTHRDTVLTGFKSLALFRKNLSQEIATEIKVSRTGQLAYISTTTQRTVNYPIEQENAVKAEYEVDSLGVIRER